MARRTGTGDPLIRGDGQPARPRPLLRRRQRRHQGGYTLVVLAVVIAVMSIAVGVALPSWSTTLRREKEEELIFRGLQYAEGIRLFQRRFGRYPNSLDELSTVRPRCLRRAWADPFSEDGSWAPVFLEAAGEGRPGRSPGAAPRLARGAVFDSDADDGANPAENVQGLPIVGVRSKAKGSKQAVRSFFGSREIAQWRFTMDLVMPGGGGGGGSARRPRPGAGPGVNVGGAPVSMEGAGAGGATVPRAAWIGRSFRAEMEQNPLGSSGLEPSDLGGQPATKPARPPRGPGGMPQQLIDEEEAEADGDSGDGAR